MSLYYQLKRSFKTTVLHLRGLIKLSKFLKSNLLFFLNQANFSSTLILLMQIFHWNKPFMFKTQFSSTSEKVFNCKLFFAVVQLKTFQTFLPCDLNALLPTIGLLEAFACFNSFPIKQNIKKLLFVAWASVLTNAG